jgi:PTS system nitrogen regulatory IIA component
MAEWMTVKQVAEYLQMSDDKIYDMAKKGELPAVKIRQQWRFDREELDRWLKKTSNLNQTRTR